MKKQRKWCYDDRRKVLLASVSITVKGRQVSREIFICVEECAPNGAYISLANSSTSRTVDLSRWSLTREVDRKSKHRYTIPDGVLLEPGRELRIYAKTSSTTSFDSGSYQRLINNNLASWGISIGIDREICFHWLFCVLFRWRIFIGNISLQSEWWWRSILFAINCYPKNIIHRHFLTISKCFFFSTASRPTDYSSINHMLVYSNKINLEKHRRSSYGINHTRNLNINKDVEILQ